MKIDKTIKKSLLFIPDISGFTHFVNQFVSRTEIIHGVHIISELLEIIIKNNTMNLVVAEIEGDAVFFYRNGKKPTVEEVYQQCSKMFLAFHHHLKLYERDRICDCGSCTSATKLTLKFVVHYGEIMERNILGHLQLMGADVTKAHKLMKNEISTHQYLLISENSVDNSNANDLPEWLKLENSSSDYDDIGKINYQFAYLAPLLKLVPELQERRTLDSMSEPLKFEIEIDCDYRKTHELLINLERKHEWTVGIRAIKFAKDKINRVGTRHQCVLPLNSLSIETVKNEIDEEKIIYVETTDASGIIPESSQAYIIENISENRCRIKIEFRHKATFLRKYLLERVIKKGLEENFSRFKELIEKETKLKLAELTTTDEKLLKERLHTKELKI